MPGPTSYRERLTAPPSWWLAAAAFGVSCGWIVLVISSWVPALVTAAVVTAGIGLALHRFGGTLVEVDAEGLSIGRARLAHEFVGTAEALHREDYRRRLGVEADARAHLVTRPYLDRGVAVQVTDPADPTPYWLVSSRRPDALAASISSLLASTPTPKA